MNLVEKLMKADDESPKNIMVIGDLMRDIYIYGHAEGCQENCVCLKEVDRIGVPGGVGNAARTLAYWRSGSNLRVFAQHCGESIKTRFITGVNTIQFRHDCDHICEKPEKVHFKVWTALEDEGYAPDAVLLSDYNKGVLTVPFITKMIRFCNVHHIPCVVDAKRDPKLYEGAVIKGNAEWAWKFKPKMTTENMVVTNGKENPTIAGRFIRNQYLPVNCINHVGAGDCFSAHMTMALAHELSLEDAVTVAHSAARVYVQKPYNEPPKREPIADDLWAALDEV